MTDPAASREPEVPASRQPGRAEPARASSPATDREVGFGAAGESRRGFIPPGPPRLAAESVLVRLVASAGVVAIGTVLGAILAAYDVAGWIIGLAVSAVSLVMAAVLWRSRRL